MAHHVLIVEDEDDIREAMKEALESANFTVTAAKNGEEGLAAAIQHHPDVILLDIVMPIMDGPEMLRRLRQDSWGIRAKVIMLTSMDNVNNIAAAYDDGDVSDYIIKAHHSLREIIQKIQIVLHAE